VPNDVSERSLRISDLRRAHPADASLENLLNTLTGKIEACARLAVFEYEADSEGHPALARVFHELAGTERESFNTLLTCLRRHLDEMPDAKPDHGAETMRRGRR